MKKQNYIKVKATVTMAMACGHLTTLSAKSGKTKMSSPKELTINGYGESASFTVDSKNLRSDEPISISATHGFEVSPRQLNPNGNGKVTVKLVSSQQQTSGKIILRSGDTRYYVDVKGLGRSLPIKDLSSSPAYTNDGKTSFEKAFTPSDKGHTIEFKVAIPADGDEFYPYAVDTEGKGFKGYVAYTTFGLYHSTSQADGFSNPSTNVTGGRGKFYNNDGKAHTYRIAVMPDNRAFFYRDGIAVDTVRLQDYGLQPDFATGNGEIKENLLKNPGFEGEFENFGVKNAEDVAKGIEGWNIAIHDYWCSQQSIVPEEIDDSLDFNNHVAQIRPYMWANGWGNGNINQIVDVAPNETYTLTALAKGGIREKEGTLTGTMFIEEVQDREKEPKWI
ncbi:MAG: carbohydrate-binding protein [Paraprevotella sp.]|nr:carbohydrate-binding protein [Paraprevotella sp.]